MKVVTLASGSKGNSTYVGTKDANILIDAGLTLKQIEERLSFVKVDPSTIDAIILTHEHSDHIKGVGLFARKYGVKVYCHKLLYEVIEKRTGISSSSGQIIFFDDNFYIKDMYIEAFEVPHDSIYCVGFNVFNEGKKFSIATDLGHTNSRIIEKLKDSTLVILEANYEEAMLRANTKYPVYLKSRIKGRRGHLSNVQATEVIAMLSANNVKQVVLGHLSEENNAPEVAFNAIKEGLEKLGVIEGKHIFVDVSTQKKVGNIFKLK